MFEKSDFFREINLCCFYFTIKLQIDEKTPKVLTSGYQEN